MKPPDFFEEIQRQACRRWEQLDSDPELFGPWRLLFSQVQSPRHVLSELLQNADDAGATLARAYIEDGVFVFEHDGHDFTADEFASLCRFGFSNKATLHTIGFRGIGFKSAFSLGDEIRLLTPSLSVCFRKSHFTEPIWLSDSVPIANTRISVRLSDRERERELRKNLEDWAASPVSVLFFKHIEELVIGDAVIKKAILGEGPVPNSVRVRLGEDSQPELFLFRSEEEPFPWEAIEEIRAERGAPDLDLPSCGLEAVLGLKDPQRLYVILPTRLYLAFPFSLNGPFLQDPARTGIKSPSTSPTNRWLLHRAGKLVGAAMLAWLRNQYLTIPERAEAYRLLFAVAEETDTLEADICSAIESGFQEAVGGAELLLAVNGELVSRQSCLAPPIDAYEVWSPGELPSVFRSDCTNVLATEVTPEARENLCKRDWLDESTLKDLIDALNANSSVPRPLDTAGLLALWALIQEVVRYDWNGDLRKSLHIVPVRGSSTLACARSVARIPEKSQSWGDGVLSLLLALLPLVDGEWLEFLDHTEKPLEAASDAERKIQKARQLLHELGLDRPTATDRIADLACSRWTSQGNSSLDAHVRILHLMAALDAKAPDWIHYFTRDQKLRSWENGIIKPTSSIEELLPEEWAASHLLHDAYFEEDELCSRQKWDAWVSSDKSRCSPFVCLETRRTHLFSRNAFEQLCKEKQAQPLWHYPYCRGEFVVTDIDFPEQVWSFWHSRSPTDVTLWGKVAEEILRAPSWYWEGHVECGAQQRSQKGRTVSLDWKGTSAWIVRLRALPCLEDEYGKLHVPAELYIRTPQTEPLLGVEPFVCAQWDREETRPLLKLLGCRDTPTDVGRLLDRLRALTRVPEPSQVLSEVVRWYQALDKVLARAEMRHLIDLRSRFSEERLILTETCQWVSSRDVFRFTGDEYPDAPVVHPAVRALPLWEKLALPERPDAQLVLEWVNRLASSQRVEDDDYRRLRTILSRNPSHVWDNCRHWLTLDRKWTPIGEIRYRLTMSALVPWTRLFLHIKSATADLQMLSREQWCQAPFSRLRELAQAIEYRPERLPSNEGLKRTSKAWINTFCSVLMRVRMDDASMTTEVRAQAGRLARSAWVLGGGTDSIMVTPYVDGEPAGPPEPRPVLWHEETVYVGADSLARSFDALVQELARPFASQEVAEALKICAERDDSFIVEYLQTRFEIEADEGRVQVREVSAENVDHTPPGNPHEVSEVSPPGPPGGPGHEECGDGGTRDSHPRQPTSPSLFAQFARRKGFQWDRSVGEFVHPRGGRIKRAANPMKWEEYDAAGHLVMRYWHSKSRLTGRGIEIPFELWELLRSRSDEICLVLQGQDGGPELYEGSRLREMFDNGRLELHPARYRLRVIPEE